MIGAVFVFPHGVVWGGGAPIKKARKYGGLTPLIDGGDLSAASYSVIQRIHYTEPSMVSNGNFAIVIPENATSKWARFAGSVVFEKKHRNVFRTAYGMIDARCRQAQGQLPPPPAGGLPPPPSASSPPPPAGGLPPPPSAAVPPPPAGGPPPPPSSDSSQGPSDPAAGPVAGWYPDPSGRHQLRYFDGADWSDYASTNGGQVYDPL